LYSKGLLRLVLDQLLLSLLRAGGIEARGVEVVERMEEERKVDG